jgi:hypothetical protein
MSVPPGILIVALGQSAKPEYPYAASDYLLLRLEVWIDQLLLLRLGFLQTGVAARSSGGPTRRNRSWKRGLSRKPSMLGSI